MLLAVMLLLLLRFLSTLLLLLSLLLVMLSLLFLVPSCCYGLCCYWHSCYCWRVPTVVNIPFRGSVVVSIPWCSGPLLCCSPAAVDVSGIYFGDPAVIGVPLHPSFILYRCRPFCCCSSFCCWRQFPCCGWSLCSYCGSNCYWHPFCYRCFQHFWRPCSCWPSCWGLAYLLWPFIPLLLASLHPLTTPLLMVFYCFWHPCFCWCPLIFQISLVLLLLWLFTLLLFFHPCGTGWLGSLLLLLSHCCWCLFYWFLLFPMSGVAVADLVGLPAMLLLSLLLMVYSLLPPKLLLLQCPPLVIY
jgi:hypothetical protein